MQAMNVSLPAGPYDWDPRLNPRAAFEGRLARLRAAMPGLGVDAVLIHGNTFDYGALAYITGFVPKLGSAFAFVPAFGEVRLVFTGGPGIRPSAALLTWVGDVSAYRAISEIVGAWMPSGVLGLWGGQVGFDEWNGVVAALGTDRVRDVDPSLGAFRRRKDPAERALIASALTIAEEVAAAMRAGLTGGMRPAALRAERAGYAMGAQDVRIMASRTPGGPPLPVEDGDTALPDPAIHVAVRYAGYLAEASDPGSATTHAILAQAARPGCSLQDIQESLRAIGAARVTGEGIGLSFAEAPYLASPEERLAEGDVISLHIGFDGHPGSAIVTLAVDSDGASVLNTAS